MNDIVQDEDLCKIFIPDQLVHTPSVMSRINDDDSLKIRNQERDHAVCVGILEDHQHLFGFGSGIDNDFRMIAAKEYIVLAFGGQALNVKYGS